MSNNVYWLYVEDGANMPFVFIVHSKFSMKKWLTGFTDMGYTVGVRQLTDQEKEQLTNKK